MSDHEIVDLRARLDRLESLVGTCMAEDGTIIPALLNAANQSEIAQMKQEIEAVVSFLRENRP